MSRQWGARGWSATAHAEVSAFCRERGWRLGRGFHRITLAGGEARDKVGTWATWNGDFSAGNGLFDHELHFRSDQRPHYPVAIMSFPYAPGGLKYTRRAYESAAHRNGARLSDWLRMEVLPFAHWYTDGDTRLPLVCLLFTPVHGDYGQRRSEPQ